MTTGLLPSDVLEIAVAADRTPAHRYLIHRKVWPPGAAELVDLPANLRWVEAEKLVWKNGSRAMPATAAGAMVAIFEDVDKGAELIKAVELEALDEDGKVLDGRWRRTIGSKDGGVFRLRNEVSERSDGHRVVHLCEGVLDAFAIFWDNDDHPGEVWAYGGTSEAGRVPEVKEGGMVIHCDGDKAGLEAAEKLFDINLDINPVIDICAEGDDPASEFAKLVIERDGWGSVELLKELGWSGG